MHEQVLTLYGKFQVNKLKDLDQNKRKFNVNNILERLITFDIIKNLISNYKSNY